MHHCPKSFGDRAGARACYADLVVGDEDPMSTALVAPVARPFVSGGPRWLLRLEGLGVLAAAAVAYGQFGIGWPWFFALFLAPDLAMIGYFAGPKLGALAYNATHSYLGPLALGSAATWTGNSNALAVSMIWAAHIGFDRMLGYGLKYASAFGNTHLGAVGRRRSDRVVAPRGPSTI